MCCVAFIQTSSGKVGLWTLLLPKGLGYNYEEVGHLQQVRPLDRLSYLNDKGTPNWPLDFKGLLRRRRWLSRLFGC